MASYNKKAANQKMEALTTSELQDMLAKLISGRISVSDNSRRTKIRVIKKHLEVRKKATQTLMGDKPTGFSNAQHGWWQPSTQDYLKPF